MTLFSFATLRRVIAPAAVGVLLTAAAASTQNAPPAQSAPPDPDTAYVCPMHPDYTSDIAGQCPRCAMPLVLGSPYDTREYLLDMQTTPPVVKAGEAFTLTLSVRHPDTGELVGSFETVHEKQYHLFVISQDMESFQHLHPEQKADGSWSIVVTIPKAGYYKVLSDFLPGLGSSQFIARPLVTAHYDGDLVSGEARLVPDASPTKSEGDLKVTVTYEPPTFIAGLFGHLRFSLIDASTSEPVDDLQTYLGAFGHTLIMNEDMTEYVHSHPVDQLPVDVDLEAVRGGPFVSFEGLFPRPGRYRAWTQFRRGDRIHTFTSTFEVKDASAQ